MNISILSTSDVLPVNSGVAERIFQTANILGKEHIIGLYYFESKTNEKGRIPDSFTFNRYHIPGTVGKRHDNPSPQSIFRPISILHLELLLKTFIDQSKVDIIQCEVPVNFLHAYKYKLKYKVPIVLTAHDIVFLQYKRSRSPLWPVIKAIETTCFKLADHVVAVSEYDKNIIAKYVSPEKITVIPNGVDVELYRQQQPKMDLRKIYNVNGPILGFHGPLDYEPNREAAEIIIKSLVPRLNKVFGSYTVLLIGPNPPEVTPPQVVCTGVVDDLPKYLRSLDAAIIPLASGSGTRLKILEYLASGIPIVASRIAAEGINVRNYEHLLFAEDFAEDFVTKVVEVIKEDSLRRKLSENGRKLVEKHYSWEQIIPKYSRVYEKVMEEKQRK